MVLKSRRLLINARHKPPSKIRVTRSAKYGHSAKSTLFEVQPMMDWGAIIELKLAACVICADYNELMGGCKHGWLSTECQRSDRQRNNRKVK